jgi:rubrerythrin
MDLLSTARSAGRRAVQEFLHEADPAAFGLQHEHEIGELEETEPRLLAVVRATALLRETLQHALADALLTARSRGESWADLAAALGVKSEEAAFLAALDADSAGAATDLVWVCTTCGRAVRDRGPAVPASEVGHDVDCVRSAGQARTLPGVQR